MPDVIKTSREVFAFFLLLQLPSSISSSLVMDRVFDCQNAKGGEDFKAETTAVVFIEMQNEFTTEGGKLHDSVKANMASTNLLENSEALLKNARAAGVKVMHIAIIFKEDMSDNPNKGLGILKGCNDGKLFIEGTWGAQFHEKLSPQEGDIVVNGKKGLDAFPGSELEGKLKEHNITTVAFGGFLTNCCVESTMRTAYEKGYNVIGLTDCTATNSEEGYKASVAGTWNFFSAPMTSTQFLEKLNK